MRKQNYEIDMCSGPLLGKMVVFAIPLVLSGILQLLFNAADIIVVGRFSGSNSMAAVGSTGPLINLLVNLFIGFSVGTNVLVARYFGGRHGRDVEETVHTSILMALAGGGILTLIGVGLARLLLGMMATPADVIDLAVLYMRIFFLGMPASLVYNFGSAILRAVGDTQRPLYILSASGLVNVVLNVFFVVSLGWNVAGVAASTVISQYLSAVLIVRCLTKTDAMYQVRLNKLRFVRDKVKIIVRIGLPAGLQGAVFSISNVLIQSSVNSFGSIAMAGNTASSNIEGFVYTSMNAIYQTTLSFTSQNFGAGNLKRIKKILAYGFVLVTGIGVLFGVGILSAAHRLLTIYSADPEVLSVGIRRLQIIASTYVVCGMMDTIVGAIRGIGYSIMPMIVALTGACAFRIIWIFTVFRIYRSLEILYISYPVSWFITLVAHVICFVLVFRKLEAQEADN